MTTDSIKALGRYAKIFAREGFSWGRWIDPKHPQTMPHFEWSDEASAFVEDAYKHGWVLKDFDWSRWIDSEDGVMLRAEPGAIGRADAEELFMLLTCYVRGDRFREGALAEAYDDGKLTQIVRRAAGLVDAD